MVDDFNLRAVADGRKVLPGVHRRIGKIRLASTGRPRSVYESKCFTRGAWDHEDYSVHDAHRQRILCASR